MKTKLFGSPRRTSEAIFRHPAADNLEWHDVRSRLGVLGEVVEEDHGEPEITRSGQALWRQGFRSKDVT